MKLTAPILACIAGAAALVIAGEALAVSFFPLHTKSDLRGTLKFYPAGGGHAAFKCKVRLVLRTGAGVVNHTRTAPRIKVATIDPKCADVIFDELPWTAGPGGDRVTASVAPFSWSSQGGLSCHATMQLFSIDKSGVWSTNPGGCVVGSLTSSPPVTIVK